MHKPNLNMEHASYFPGFVTLLLCCVVVVSGYELTILHTNDVHARFEEFNKYGSKCNDDDARDGTCFGGVARRYTKLQELRNSHDNVLFLDAGDQFMGTTWFSVHHGAAVAYFMALLQYDVMCLGNHEFDTGVDGLRTFLDNITFPVVSANLDVTNEPSLQGKFQKTWTTTVGGETIGVVGYITPETAHISAGGSTVRFNDILPAVRVAVAEFEYAGINKIIALGHAGYTMDKRVAAIDGIDLVIGGHTNTFLYNGEAPSGEEIEGPYPTVVQQPGGNQGLVVHDYTMGKYLGYLNLTFDAQGVVTSYAGNPVLLDASVQEDAGILQYVNEWKIPVDAMGAQDIGYSKVMLDGECMLEECNLGNLVTDAIIDYHVSYPHPTSAWAPAAIVFWNGGGIRSSIGKGVVIAGNAIGVMPFGNEIDVLTVSGENIRDQLELSVRDWDRIERHGRFLQMSGLRVVYNLQKPAGERVVSVEVRCLECDIPSYSPLKDGSYYNVLVSTFIINGGDGYNFKPTRRQRFNTLDVTTLMEYFKKYSPVYPQVEGRIRFHIDSVSAGSSQTTVLYALLLSIQLFIAFY